MLNRMKIALALAALSAVCAFSMKGDAQKQPVIRPLDKLTLGAADVRHLLLLMDTDRNGKISKQEWMKFMDAEFDRLDKEKSGVLDVKDIAHSQLSARRFADDGK
jgi:hypothetical protein